MLDLRPWRPFWQVKAECADFADFLEQLSTRTDHVTVGGSPRQPLTNYHAGLLTIQVREDGAARLNIFRPLRETVYAHGTPLVHGADAPGSPLHLLRARYGGQWFDAVDWCYLPEELRGRVWMPSWEGLEQGFEQACRFAWETAELSRALDEAWAAEPASEPAELFARVWPGWWAGLATVAGEGAASGQ